MKKITILFLLIAPAALIISSCRKEPADVTKTINVNLNMNESYSAAIPAKDAEGMQITSQAQHYTVSTFGLDPGTNSNVFHYTPALDYTGTDEVQIAKGEDKRQGNHHSGGGGCGSHEEGKVTYIYKITVSGDVTTP